MSLLVGISLLVVGGIISSVLLDDTGLSDLLGGAGVLGGVGEVDVDDDVLCGASADGDVSELGCSICNKFRIVAVQTLFHLWNAGLSETFTLEKSFTSPGRGVKSKFCSFAAGDWLLAPDKQQKPASVKGATIVFSDDWSSFCDCLSRAPN